MKKAYFSIIAVIFTISLSIPVDSHAQLKDLLNKAKQTVLPSEDGDVGLGLKQALEFGVNEAVQKLSADKGYLESPYKILIPEEARTIIAKVKMVPGFQDVEQQLIDKMNKAAELAAKKATPIFVEAITDMTFKDAMNILLGEQDAATRYLETETRTQLYNLFLPVIQSALDEVNARTYWTSVMNAYNSIPFVKKVNPALDDHVNNKALDGLFSLIEVKEGKIRGDQSERKTDLLKKVFAKQDKG
jgi:hypothetical protein